MTDFFSSSIRLAPPDTLAECQRDAETLRADLTFKTCNWITGCVYRAQLQWKIDQLRGKEVGPMPNDYNYDEYPLDREFWFARC